MDWSTAALDPGAWHSTVLERGCRFMAAWVWEREAHINWYMVICQGSTRSELP